MIEFEYVLLTAFVLVCIAVIILVKTGNRAAYFTICAVALSIVVVYGYYGSQESEQVYLKELPHIKNKINQTQSASDIELFTRIELYCDLYSSFPGSCKTDLRKEYFSLP